MSEIDAVEPTVKIWIEDWVKRVDTNDDGRISYYEFLYIVLQLKELKMGAVTDQDLEDTKTNVQRGIDVEKLPLNYVGAGNWLAKIYILKQKQKKQKNTQSLTLDLPTITIELTTPEDSNTSSSNNSSFEDPWSEERKQREAEEPIEEVDPLAHLRKDTYSEKEWDIESHVNSWDLDKLVDEVFSEENSSELNDLFTFSNNDPTIMDGLEDELTEEHFEEFAKQRRRKRDIVLGVIKTIIRSDSKTHTRTQSSPVAGSEDAPTTPTDETASPPVTPNSAGFLPLGYGSRRRMFKEKVIQKLRAGSWNQKSNQVVTNAAI